MNIVALLAVMATGVTGMFLLATWLGMGGHRATTHPGRLPNALVLGHVGAAVVVFLLWVLFVVSKTAALAVTAAALLLVVVALGLGLLRRWLVQLGDPRAVDTAERELARGAVVVHGAFATITVITAFLAVTRL